MTRDQFIGRFNAGETRQARGDTLLAASHIVAGAAIGKACPRAAVAVSAAFVSHFALDLVPHSSFHMLPQAAGWLRWCGAAIDIVAAILILFLAWRMRERWVMIGAALAGFLPDLLDYVQPVATAFHALPGTSYMTWVHKTLHVDVSSTYWSIGFITQIVVVAVGMLVILRRDRRHIREPVDPRL